MRRFSIGVIILVFLVVLGNYFQMRRHRSGVAAEKHHILGPDMILSASGIEYTENRSGAGRFKLHAEKRLETRGGKNYLQGIEAYILNADGSVRNSIRSQDVEYDRERRLADFSGDVRIHVSNGMELRMNSLHYDQNAKLATTEDRIQIISDSASGTARGVLFDQARGSVDLKSNVDLVVTQERTNAANKTEKADFHIISQRASFLEATNRFRFQGKATVETDSDNLCGDEIVFQLNRDRKHLRSLISTGRAVYRSREETDKIRALSGDRMQFSMDGSSGRLQNVHILGHAAFSSFSRLGEEELRAAEIRMGIDPGSGLPVQIHGDTAVRFELKEGERQRVLVGDQLDAKFVPGTKNLESIYVDGHAGIHETGKDLAAKELEAEEIHIFFRGLEGRSVPERIQAHRSVELNFKTVPETFNLKASSLELSYSGEGDYPESGTASGNVVLKSVPPGGSTRPQLRRLDADNIKFRFYPRENRPQDMFADGHVRVKYEKKSDPSEGSKAEEFETASDRMQAFFSRPEDGGAIKEAAQWGNFSYKDSSYHATAGRCEYKAGNGILILTESPKVTDSRMGITTGEQIEYDQIRSVLTVRQKVRSVFIPGSGTNPLWGSSKSGFPVVITADEMRYRSDTAKVQYIGSVQLLSEEQQLESEELEIAGGGEEIKAQGNVRHLLQRTGIRNSGLKKAGNSFNVPIKIQSATLTYRRSLNTVSYEGNVFLRSADFDISSGTLVIRWGKEGIDQTTARGNVLIHQGSKECNGEIAHYYPDPERIEILGSPAIINDPGRGRSLARRVITFLNEDKTELKSR